MVAIPAAVRLAVLIDSDYAQPGIVEGLLTEIAKFGTGNAKRIVGDWSRPQWKAWKEVPLTHSIQPIRQSRYSASTDLFELRERQIGEGPGKVFFVRAKRKQPVAP